MPIKEPNITLVDSLQNHFLIAMPSLTDKYFNRSVTYILEHGEQGAMGIVINQPSNMTFRELLGQVDEKAPVSDSISEKIVLCGGPVQADRGFVIHESSGEWNSSTRITEDIVVTTSKDILLAIGKENGPQNNILTLGYAGWEAGQLEQEIQENSWLTIPASKDILFDTPIHKRWETAVNKLGIDIWQLTQQAGSA